MYLRLADVPFAEKPGLMIISKQFLQPYPTETAKDFCFCDLVSYLAYKKPPKYRNTRLVLVTPDVLCESTCLKRQRYTRKLNVKLNKHWGNLKYVSLMKYSAICLSFALFIVLAPVIERARVFSERRTKKLKQNTIFLVHFCNFVIEK